MSLSNETPIDPNPVLVQNSKLCETCRTLFSNRYDERIVRHGGNGGQWTQREITTSRDLVHGKCPVCQALAQAHYKDFGYTCLPGETENSWTKMLEYKGFVHRLHLTENAEHFWAENTTLALVPANTYRGEPIGTNTGSDLSWNIVNLWVSNCISNHPLCRGNRTDVQSLPTRLIDIGSGPIPMPKLCIVSEETPLEPYASLSHCWGSCQPMQLLQGNLKEMTKRIPIEELSRTFRDALVAAHKLNLRYIWVDSLCIIQDSEEDWLEQSALMTQVYSNAFINIAAAHASDGSYGCFLERDPDDVKPIEVLLEWGPRPGIYHVFDDDSLRQEVDFAPLHKRAWVVQERLLARRTLHYCEAQLFWECNEIAANESFPDGILRPIDREWTDFANFLDQQFGHSIAERRRLLNSNAASSDVALEHYRLWDEIVHRYAPCILTFAKDKLVALSGLAAKMQEIMKCRYLAGMWENQFSYQLLWQGHYQPLTKPEVYVAPSWSWASVNGEVSRVAMVPILDNSEIMIEILDIHVDLLSPRYTFGQVTGGYLRVEGVLARQSIAVTSPSASDVGHHPWARVSGLFLTRPYMDDINYVVEGKELYFMPVKYDLHSSRHQTFQRVEGIILDPTGQQPDEYKRVGKFSVDGGGIIRGHLDADEGALEAFKEACVLTSGPGGPERYGDWGKKRTLTIV